MASRRVPRLLALVQRALWQRPTGQWPRWGENCETRAAKWLEVLEQASPSLGFRVKLEQLCLQTDLMTEEEALKPNCRRLQVKALLMERDFEALVSLCEFAHKNVPIAKLFSSIVLQADGEGAEAIRIGFLAEPLQKTDLDSRGQDALASVERARAGRESKTPPLSEACLVRVLKDGEWRLMIALPQILAPSLRGLILRFEAASLEGIFDFRRR